MSDQDPAALLADVNRALKWAVFLLLLMVLILVIDLQLKRAIAKTGMDVATRSDALTRMADRIMADLTRKGAPGGRQTVAADRGDAGHRGDAGRDGLDGDARVAAGTGQADGQAAGVPAAAPAGPRKRAPRNGGRASGPPA